MIITKEIDVVLHRTNIKHYEGLGYKIPRKKDGYILRGTKIKIKTEDLLKNSNIKIEIQCDICKKIFFITNQKYNKYVHDDGSYYCNSCATTLFNSGENHPLYRKTRSLETRKKISKGRIGKYTRENSPNWNPNITQEERDLRRDNVENIDWKKKIITRDNHTCKCCGKVGNHDIVAHHLDGWNWCKEKRYDEANGVTLCETCHQNFHSIHGYGNNTKEQFEEWVGYTIKLVKYEEELPTAKKIYCIEENRVYNSAVELAKEWGLKNKSGIYDVCNHKIKHCRKKRYKKDGMISISSYTTHSKTINNKHLIWYDEYIFNQKEN